MHFENEETLLEQGVIIHRNVREAGILLKTPDGLAIKCFKSKGLILSFLRSLFSQTKAHKQWDATQKLLSLNLKTPAPIEIKLLHPSGVYEAAFIYEYIEDAIPFHDAIRECKDYSLLDKLAHELAHLASHNSLFIDFHLGNVLVDSASNLWWIDPEIKTSRSYTKERFWSRMVRMHEKCDPGVLSEAQWIYFTKQLNLNLPSWLKNESITTD
jgi:hypothetical protein